METEKEYREAHRLNKDLDNVLEIFRRYQSVSRARGPIEQYFGWINPSKERYTKNFRYFTENIFAEPLTPTQLMRKFEIGTKKLANTITKTSNSRNGIRSSKNRGKNGKRSCSWNSTG